MSLRVVSSPCQSLERCNDISAREQPKLKAIKNDMVLYVRGTDKYFLHNFVLITWQADFGGKLVFRVPCMRCGIAVGVIDS